MGIVHKIVQNEFGQWMAYRRAWFRKDGRIGGGQSGSAKPQLGLCNRGRASARLPGVGWANATLMVDTAAGAVAAAAVGYMQLRQSALAAARRSALPSTAARQMLEGGFPALHRRDSPARSAIGRRRPLGAGGCPWPSP